MRDPSFYKRLEVLYNTIVALCKLLKTYQVNCERVPFPLQRACWTARRLMRDQETVDRMTETNQFIQQDLAAELMGLFLPIHYRIGVGFEEALRCGRLSRKQVAILWLMRAEGGPEGSMRRKDIERLLASWFETSSSTITRALAALSRPPLKLVRVAGDRDSGREKRVTLTPRGEQFLSGMTAEGRAFTQKLLDGMPRQEIQEMVRLMQKAIAVLGHHGINGSSSGRKNGKRQPL
jgi:DNA-binding MarR family transcriptional regulator